MDAEVKALEKIELDSKQGYLMPLDIDAPVNCTQYTAHYIRRQCRPCSIEIANSKLIPKDSSLRYFDPYLDDVILQIGGRIRTGDARADEHGPIIIH